MADILLFQPIKLASEARQSVPGSTPQQTKVIGEVRSHQANVKVQVQRLIALLGLTHADIRNATRKILDQSAKKRLEGQLSALERQLDVVRGKVTHL